MKEEPGIKKLPIGIQNINEILSGDFVYVDKTDLAYHLITNAKHYFMSRPRRFGKSLFLSTLEKIFKGNKELFKNCKIYKSKYNWPKHPVLYFDFSRIPNRTPQEFEDSLKRKIQSLAFEHSISIEVPTLEEGLEALVIELSKQNKVVILVDEYDKPIINNLKNLEIAEQNRDILKSFFTVLKGLDEYLKFSFMTGVSKFSQVSLFSGPNNVLDISMDKTYSHLMGYTEAEIKHSFSAHMQNIVQDGAFPSEKHILDTLRTWYNGYCFSKKCTSVYNPFSTLNFMNTGEVESYWYSSGTPSFLIEQVKKNPDAVVPISGVTSVKSSLSDISNFDRIDFTALMFQTGYLTIVGYDAEEDIYRLDFPNEEVRHAFFNSLLQEFAEINPVDVSRSSKQIREDLNNQDLKSFVTKMNQHFAKIAYSLFANAKEGFYHAIFLTFLEKSGIRTHAEVATNIGRVDLVADTPTATCIFEFKLDQSASIAFDQAELKHYKERFTDANKNILVIGLNFSSTSRNISEWKSQLFSPDGKKLNTN